MTQPDQEIYGLLIISSDPTRQTSADFNVVEHITRDVHDIYLAAAGRLEKAMKGSLLAYAQSALADLTATIRDIRELLQSCQIGVPTLQMHGHELNTTVACRVLTFCSALHLYQEQSEAIVTRVHEDHSVALSTVKQAFKEAYDASLQHYVTYRLRNVLVHHSLQCISLNVRATEEQTPSGLILHQYVVTVPLKRDDFLSTPRAVGSETRQKLLDLDEDPDLVVWCDGAMRSLERLHREILNHVYPQQIEDARAVLELDSRFRGFESDPEYLQLPTERALVHVPNVYARPLSMPHRLLTRELFEHARTVVGAGTDQPLPN